MIFTVLMVLMSFAWAEGENTQKEKAKDLVVYVDKPEVTSEAGEKISSKINEKTIVGYVSQHIRNSKAKTGYASWSSVSYVYDNINVYDQETIGYAYDNCNYRRDSLKCGVKNNHHTVKTYISITEHEIVTRMVFYSPQATIISQTSSSAKEVVRWIKQQEITIVQQEGMMGRSTMIHVGKEELPLKWQIPPQIWDRQFYRLSIGLFTAVKID